MWEEAENVNGNYSYLQAPGSHEQGKFSSYEPLIDYDQPMGS